MRNPDQIKSREDFVAFIAELEADLQSNSDKWENPTLDRYLEAVGAWANDLKWGQNVSASLDRPEAWKLAAILFYVGKIYE